ncbi:hypothetical protein PVAP13_9NG817877 [Panicum virgatum]|uniref:Uncharacterized protein n=1 Tax=Panicum virgatum TaxID=38727 RepID=A0A8T0N125_PANVG|nr:hypothetical protein PVAP13_9NG817877 [Panicum virgatum]
MGAPLPASPKCRRVPSAARRMEARHAQVIRGEISVLRPHRLDRSPASTATSTKKARSRRRLEKSPQKSRSSLRCCSRSRTSPCALASDEGSITVRDTAAVEKAPDGPGLAPANKLCAVRPEERVVYTRLCSRPLWGSLLEARAVTHARASRVVRRHHRATSLGNAGRHWFPGRAPATPTTSQPLRLSNVLRAQVERTGT